MLSNLSAIIAGGKINHAAGQEGQANPQFLDEKNGFVPSVLNSLVNSSIKKEPAITTVCNKDNHNTGDFGKLIDAINTSRDKHVLVVGINDISAVKSIMAIAKGGCPNLFGSKKILFVGDDKSLADAIPAAYRNEAVPNGSVDIDMVIVRGCTPVKNVTFAVDSMEKIGLGFNLVHNGKIMGQNAIDAGGKSQFIKDEWKPKNIRGVSPAAMSNAGTVNRALTIQRAK